MELRLKVFIITFSVWAINLWGCCVKVRDLTLLCNYLEVFMYGLGFKVYKVGFRAFVVTFKVVVQGFKVIREKMTSSNQLVFD